MTLDISHTAAGRLFYAYKSPTKVTFSDETTQKKSQSFDSSEIIFLGKTFCGSVQWFSDSRDYVTYEIVAAHCFHSGALDLLLKN